MKAKVPIKPTLSIEERKRIYGSYYCNPKKELGATRKVSLQNSREILKKTKRIFFSQIKRSRGLLFRKKPYLYKQKKLKAKPWLFKLNLKVLRAKKKPFSTRKVGRYNRAASNANLKKIQQIPLVELLKILKKNLKRQMLLKKLILKKSYLVDRKICANPRFIKHYGLLKLPPFTAKRRKLTTKRVGGSKSRVTGRGYFNDRKKKKVFKTRFSYYLKKITFKKIL